MTCQLIGPWKCGINVKCVKHMLCTKFTSISCKLSCCWMPQNIFDDQSTLVQVMAWRRQATSHNLSQCCPRSISPYYVTRPQSVDNEYFEKNVITGLHCMYSDTEGFLTGVHHTAKFLPYHYQSYHNRPSALNDQNHLKCKYRVTALVSLLNQSHSFNLY